MRFKLAILNVLAKCRGGHATLDEVRREVEIIVAIEDRTQQLKRFSALGDIDIFQSGLVLRDDAGLQITDAGLSLLGSLENSSGPSLEISSAPASKPFRLIDELIGAEERLRIFDLELRGLDDNAQESTDHNPYPSEQEEETGWWRSECLILFRKLVLWICLEGSIPKFLMGLVMVTTINPLRREASERSRWGFQILPLSCGGASVLRSKRRVESRLSY